MSHFTPIRLVYCAFIILLLIAIWRVLDSNSPERYHRRRLVAACILNQRNVQQAVRAIQNMNHLKPGDTIVWDEIFGPEKFLSSKPTCLSDGDYTLANVIPEPGILVCPCRNPDHKPSNFKDW